MGTYLYPDRNRGRGYLGTANHPWYSAVITYLTTSGTSVAVRVVTATTTLTAADDVVVCNSALAMTANLPAATGSGRRQCIKNIGVGTVTVDGSGSETIDGVTTKPLLQWEAMRLVDYAVGAWVMV